MNAPVEWRTIPSFPDYEASSTGLIVRAVVDQRGHKLTHKPLKATSNHAGYLELSLCRDGKVCNARVNRVICEAFHGPSPSSLHHAAHLNGVSADNTAGNLAWKLPAANEGDKVAHGTAPRGDRHWSRNQVERRSKGEGHGRSKLTADAVRAIRTDARSQRAIAAEHGVSQRVVWMVKQRKTWGHVA